MSLYLGNQKISAMTMPNKTITIDSELSLESENPVQNKVITTALNNKLNANASNLTTDGQKVFDGQWVMVKKRLANNTSYPTTEDLSYDLSDILPNDNYNYEVMIMGYATTGTTVGDEASMEVITDLTNGKSIMVGCKAICVVNGKSSTAGFNCIVPVGLQRQLTMYHQSWVTATFSLWIMGYRRIGTNQ